MRLTLKLTAALTIVLIIQFSLYGYLASRRLTGFFERDIRRDALQIGRTLSTAVSRTWKSQGADEALALIAATNDDYAEIQIRFVSLNRIEPNAKFRPDLPIEELEALKDGKFLVRHFSPDPDSDYIYTYIRIPLEEIKDGALELKQSFAPENWFTTVSVIRIIAFLLIVVVTTGFVMWLLGLFLVARPIKKLCVVARRIGRGDFSEHIEMDGHDEIAILAREINQMNDALSHSRKRLEEETASKIQAIDQLRHADRLSTIGTLASGVAHELGTPLTVALGHLNSLASTDSSPQVQKIRSSLVEQIDKMAGIVSQLLNFSRRRTPDKRPSNLGALLGRVVKMVTPFGEKRSISVRFRPPEDPVMAEVDETQIEQVLTNLIVNAIQATESGEIQVGITSEVAVNPEEPIRSDRLYRCIFVKDPGSGMTEEQAQHIFNSFFTTKAPGQGTGMGLSIAYGIVREHNGWIKVQTAVGKGSCFSVYLPAQEGTK